MHHGYISDKNGSMHMDYNTYSQMRKGANVKGMIITSGEFWTIQIPSLLLINWPPRVRAPERTVDGNELANGNKPGIMDSWADKVAEK